MRTLALAWLLSMAAAGPAMAADETAGAKPEPAVEQPALPPGVAELIPSAAALDERLSRLTRQMQAMPTYEQIEPRLKNLEIRIDTLAERLAALKADERLSYERLVEFRRAVDTVNDELVMLNEPLSSGLRKIDRWRSEWAADMESWRQWRDRIAEDLALPNIRATFDSALETIAGARERILQQMTPMLAAQERLFEIQARINAMLIEVGTLISAARGEFLRDFSPPMYAPTFFEQFGGWLVYDLVSGMARVAIPEAEFFLRKGWVIAVQIIASLAIALGIRKSESNLAAADSLQFMQRRPHSVGWLIAAAACWTLYETMPVLWQLLMMAIIVLTTARLMSAITANRRSASLIYLGAVILLATRVLIGIELPAPLFRIYLVAITLALGTACVRFLLRPSKPQRGRIFTMFLVGIGGAACAAVAVMEISGYSALALHVFRSALRTVFIVVLAWLMMRLVRGMLEAALRSAAARKIPFLRTNTVQIIDRTAKVLNILIVLLFFGAILQTWRLFTTSWEPMYRMLAFGVTIGGTRITLGLILAAAACLYGALLASRILQYFLMRDVFPRRRVDPGIGISINRLLHYAVILIGVLLALATLGFELTNLTIIVSALSVGIGFGLQTIVNNFVCGLILLFERPVKVGDIIQLGDQWATIRDIGLRATTIQTFDRSDIVVPNSDLITNQVTNWTLGDRNMRLILSVGVAYGSDVPLVLQILQECARENSRVLGDPAPMIFFMGFGDSSLDFQLRVWIDDIDYMNVVRSELNQAIDRRFRETGVEIPFPQRDLHLRSIDPPAARSFSAPGTRDTEKT